MELSINGSSGRAEINVDDGPCPHPAEATVRALLRHLRSASDGRLLIKAGLPEDLAYAVRLLRAGRDRRLDGLRIAFVAPVRTGRGDVQWSISDRVALFDSSLCDEAESWLAKP